MAGHRNPLLHTPARPLPSRVAVIGAGTIGPDIGYYLKSALPGLDVLLVDVAQAALDRAVARFTDYAAKARARGKMSAAEADAVTKGVRGTTDYDAIRGCDWVLEAATEDLALKQRIFAQATAGEGLMVGRDISGGDPYDPERFVPLTPEQMETELAAIEAAEQAQATPRPELPEPLIEDPVMLKLRRIQELRAQEDESGARRLLYQVLEEGDADQRQAARNILEQLDTP